MLTALPLLPPEGKSGHYHSYQICLLPSSLSDAEPDGRHYLAKYVIGPCLAAKEAERLSSGFFSGQAGLIMWEIR